MKYPPQNRFIQSAETNVLGSVYSSFNCDFTSNRGAWRLSPRTVLNNRDAVDLGIVANFVFYPGSSANQSRWYAVSDKGLFRTAVPQANVEFANLVVTGATFSELSDIAIFNAQLFLTAEDSLYRIAGTGTPQLQLAGTLDGSAGSMVAYGKRLYISTLGTRVVSINTSYTLVKTGSNTLQLADFGGGNLVINKLLTDGSRIWILTSNRKGLGAYVYEWDGETENDPTQEVDIESTGALAGVIHENVPYIMDAEGRLRAYNGSRFVELARLPFNNKFMQNSLGGADERWVHPNGMTVVDGRVQVLVRGQNIDGTINDQMVSGVWEYDPQIGLYHKYSLATTLEDEEIVDFGQRIISRVGGLQVNSIPNNAHGTFLAGGVYFDKDENEIAGIWHDDSKDTELKASNLVTTLIGADEVKQMWQKIFTKHSPLGKIVVKYTTDESDPVEIDIDWLNATSFVTTSSLEVGDEVEITQGVGGGMCAHVVNIENTTITLDTPINGVGEGRAKVAKWIKIGEFENTDQITESNIDFASPWVRIKVYTVVAGKKNIYGFELTNTKQQ